MSRLFEALQKSEPDSVGLDFTQPEALVNELLKKADLEQPGTPAEPGDLECGEFLPTRISLPPNHRLISLASEASLGAETFRFLAVRLRQMRRTREFKRLLITSTIPAEGKSTVAANLGVTLAQRRKQKVLLVDGDLRRPTLASEFGMSGQPGLAELLRGDSGAGSNIYFLEEASLWFLPAGHPPGNPIDLMQSPKLRELLERLSTLFDWIIIDSAPILPLADTTIWTRLSDALLLVTREGTTQRRQLKAGMETLDQSKLLGVVFNNCSNSDHANYYQRYGRPSPNALEK